MVAIVMIVMIMMGIKPQVDFPPREPSTSVRAPLHLSPPEHHNDHDDDDYDEEDDNDDNDDHDHDHDNDDHDYDYDC